MYNILEYNDHYAKIADSLWRYCRDEPDGSITDSRSFKAKPSITNNTSNNGIAEAKIVVPLNYLSNFWRTLEMPLIDREVTLDLIL